jgi:hypothetical protein
VQIAQEIQNAGNYQAAVGRAYPYSEANRLFRRG